MPDYKLGKIYKIEPISSEEGDEIYIGSTCRKYLSGRLAEHVYGYNKWLLGEHAKINSFDIFLQHAPENCQITLIERFPCNGKDELIARERYYVQSLNCTNEVIPGRTKKEYYADNKETINAKKVARQRKNKEKHAEYMREYRKRKTQ